MHLITGSKFVANDAFAPAVHRFLDALTEIAAVTQT